METKRFSTRTILTATTGRLLTRSKGENNNGICDLYKLLGWMTGTQVWTLSLAITAEACKPVLEKLFPELLSITGEEIDAAVRDGDEGIDAMVARRGWPAEYEVPKVPAGQYEQRNPVEEMASMMRPNA